MDEEVIFVPEMHVYERAGMGGAAEILGAANIGGTFGDMQKKLNRILKDPVHRFAVLVDAISRQLNSRREINLHENDIVKMLKAIKNVQYISCKNPASYVLGYISTNGGQKIDKTKMNIVFNYALPFVDDVTKPDVVRYSRMWLDL